MSVATFPAWTCERLVCRYPGASRPALEFHSPPGITTAKIDPATGYLAGPYCPTTITGIFPDAIAPTQICPIHRTRAAVNAASTEPESADPAADPND